MPSEGNNSAGSAASAPPPKTAVTFGGGAGTPGEKPPKHHGVNRINQLREDAKTSSESEEEPYVAAMNQSKNRRETKMSKLMSVLGEIESSLQEYTADINSITYNVKVLSRKYQGEVAVENKTAIVDEIKKQVEQSKVGHRRSRNRWNRARYSGGTGLARSRSLRPPPHKDLPCGSPNDPHVDNFEV